MSLAKLFPKKTAARKNLNDPSTAPLFPHLCFLPSLLTNFWCRQAGIPGVQTLKRKKTTTQLPDDETQFFRGERGYSGVKETELEEMRRGRKGGLSILSVLLCASSSQLVGFKFKGGRRERGLDLKMSCQVHNCTTSTCIVQGRELLAQAQISRCYSKNHNQILLVLLLSLNSTSNVRSELPPLVLRSSRNLKLASLAVNIGIRKQRFLPKYQLLVLRTGLPLIPGLCRFSHRHLTQKNTLSCWFFFYRKNIF